MATRPWPQAIEGLFVERIVKSRMQRADVGVRHAPFAFCAPEYLHRIPLEFGGIAALHPPPKLPSCADGPNVVTYIVLLFF